MAKLPNFLVALGYPKTVPSHNIRDSGWIRVLEVCDGQIAFGDPDEMVILGDTLTFSKTGPLVVDPHSTFHEGDAAIRHGYNFRRLLQTLGAETLRVFRHVAGKPGILRMVGDWGLLSVDSYVIEGDIAAAADFDVGSITADHTYAGSWVHEKGYVYCADPGYGDTKNTVAKIMGQSGAAGVWRHVDRLPPWIKPGVPSVRRFRSNKYFSQELPLP